jgi:hypothetical protein
MPRASVLGKISNRSSWQRTPLRNLSKGQSFILLGSRVI